MKLVIYNRAPFPINKYCAEIIDNGEPMERKIFDDFYELMEIIRDPGIDGAIDANHVIKKESLALMLFDTRPEIIDYESAIDIINEIQWEINDYYCGYSHYKSEREIIEEFFGDFNLDYLAPFIV